MTFMYASRWIMASAISNRSLLYFPVVRVLDVLIARGMLESACACCMAFGTMALLFLSGVNVVPALPVEAMKAMAAAILFGLGMGFINGLVALVWPLWGTAYSLLVILVYLLSGVLFVPDELPEPVRQALSWNPVLHGAEWMRIAYFPSYHSRTLDKTFLVAAGVGTTFLALVLERYGRRLLLSRGV
jgi:capsular polysaccharide transport system permease protein